MSWKILFYRPWLGGGIFHKKKSLFSEQQIAFILRRSGGRHEGRGGVSQDWPSAVPSPATGVKKYGRLMPSEMKRLKQLEEENQRLKKLVADLSLDKEMLQDVIRRKI